MQGAFADVEAEFTVGRCRRLVVAGDEWRDMAAGDQKMRDAVGLVGGLDEKFADATDEIALGVVGFGAH